MKTKKWDKRFIRLAKHISKWGKDPSTKVGAVIFKGKDIISLGYNGFAKKVKDLDTRLKDRDIKIKLTLHAEMNALLFAPTDLKGCTIAVWPLPPCIACANAIIQKGITRCVAPIMSEELEKRWGESCQFAINIFKEVGIIVDLYKI